MVTSVTNDRCFEYRGLSTDTKPTSGVGNGSIFFEIDTSKVFMLKVEVDKTVEPHVETRTWVEI